MGRKAAGARVKRRNKNGTVLYAWRDAPGQAERTGTGPGGTANELLFQGHVLACWAAGETPSGPHELLSRTANAPQVAPAPSADPGSIPTPSLREWVGTIDQPGEYFVHAKEMSGAQVAQYVRGFAKHGALDLIGDIPLDQVTTTLAEKVMDRVLRCPACLDRASRRRIALTDARARADKEPFDHDCPVHHPANLRRHRSVQDYRSLLSAVWNAAQRADFVSANPFAERRIGRWIEPASNDDFRTALTIAQFWKCVEAHPEVLRVVPALSAHGMLRSSEMWGLQRMDFPPPPADPVDDPESLTFTLRRVWDQHSGRVRPWGKTAGSTGTPITIGGNAVKILNAHLRDDLTPNGDCPACHDGVTVWRDPLQRNPHEGCGFADIAPLIPMDICSPGHYTRKVCRRVQKRAGLEGLPFQLTHRSYRSTGATMLLRAGVSESEVVVMGRWSDPAVLRRHYFRLYGEAYDEAVRRLTAMEAAELGDDQSPTAPLEGRLCYLQDQVRSLALERDQLLDEVDQLRAQLHMEPRPHAPAADALRVKSPRPSKWARIDDGQLRAILSTSRNRVEALERVGVTPATKNYKRLEAEALRLGVTLPAKWATPRQHAA